MNNIEIIRNKDPAIKLVSENWCRGIFDYKDYCDRWCKGAEVLPLSEVEYNKLWNICERDYNKEVERERNRILDGLD